jgi:hypothetical protein
MPKLIFKASDVRRVVEHTLAAPEQRPVAYTTNPVKEIAVLLVHDDGVYLMSNGKPGDLLDPSKGEVIGSSHFVAYAQGCDPIKNEGTWWDTSRALVGGDDFAETLEGWPTEINRFLDAGATHIVIDVSAGALELSARYAGRRKVT